MDFYMFKWPWSSKKSLEPEPRPPPIRDVAAIAVQLAMPAIRIGYTTSDSPSYLGGSAHVPPGFQWPENQGRPLSLLACLDLEEVHGVVLLEWLPATGTLLFFYDIEGQPWGFDPNDRGGWAVHHVPASQGNLVTVSGQNGLPRVGVTMSRFPSYPSDCHELTGAFHLTKREEKIYNKIREEENSDPQHQIGGFPCPIQNEGMELECQLASNGVYCGKPDAYLDPKNHHLFEGAGDWRLLLQFDSDDKLDLLWGDGGIIYFWIRESDARRGDFSNSWVVLQCY